jgi:hypothetical protein
MDHTDEIVQSIAEHNHPRDSRNRIVALSEVNIVIVIAYTVRLQIVQ